MKQKTMEKAEAVLRREFPEQVAAGLISRLRAGYATGLALKNPASGGYLKEAEVAALVGVTRATVRRWRKEGRIPACNPPGTRLLRYRREDVQAFLDGRA